MPRFIQKKRKKFEDRTNSLRADGEVDVTDDDLMEICSPAEKCDLKMLRICQEIVQSQQSDIAMSSTHRHKLPKQLWLLADVVPIDTIVINETTRR